MFVALDEHFHLCDGVITRIPKADYFVKLRAKVPVLSLKQDAEVVTILYLYAVVTLLVVRLTLFTSSVFDFSMQFQQYCC